MQCLANLRSLRGKDKEAYELLAGVVKKVLEIHEKIAAQSQLQNTDTNKNCEEMPTLDFRLQTSRLLV